MKTISFLLAAVMAFSAASAEACAIVRHKSAKEQFVKLQACPATGLHKLPCKGYVIDHIKALACGGKDAPANMQWQTIAEGKAKDKWERKECGK
jgi:hypothetical protein